MWIANMKSILHLLVIWCLKSSVLGGNQWDHMASYGFLWIPSDGFVVAMVLVAYVLHGCVVIIVGACG